VCLCGCVSVCAVESLSLHVTHTPAVGQGARREHRTRGRRTRHGTLHSTARILFGCCALTHPAPSMPAHPLVLFQRKNGPVRSSATHPALHARGLLIIVIIVITIALAELVGLLHVVVVVVVLKLRGVGHVCGCGYVRKSEGVWGWGCMCEWVSVWSCRSVWFRGYAWAVVGGAYSFLPPSLHSFLQSRHRHTHTRAPPTHIYTPPPHTQSKVKYKISRWMGMDNHAFGFSLAHSTHTYMYIHTHIHIYTSYVHGRTRGRRHHRPRDWPHR
jgi:hypothetical protein